MTDGIRRKIVQGLAFAAISPVFPARAQNRTIRILVGFSPGGGTDAIARTLTDKLGQELKQPVIIENRPGAGGRLAADALLQLTDGSTYMVAPDAAIIFGTLIYQHQIRWDLQKDFTSIATLTTAPLGMAVSNDIGVKNVSEFVDWLRKNPGKANVGVPGAGGRAHFLTYSLGKAIGTDLNVVPYKGAAPLITDLLGGQLTGAVCPMDAILPHEKVGRLRVLGVLGPQRSPLMPNIPTFAEQGVKVTTGETWSGLWGNAKAPAAETERMHSAIRKVLADPAVVKALADNCSASAHFRPSDQMRKLEESEMTHWASVVKASGFKPTD